LGQHLDLRDQKRIRGVTEIIRESRLTALWLKNYIFVRSSELPANSTNFLSSSRESFSDCGGLPRKERYPIQAAPNSKMSPGTAQRTTVWALKRGFNRTNSP